MMSLWISSILFSKVLDSLLVQIWPLCSGTAAHTSATITATIWQGNHLMGLS